MTKNNPVDELVGASKEPRGFHAACEQLRGKAADTEYREAERAIAANPAINEEYVLRTFPAVSERELFALLNKYRAGR